MATFVTDTAWTQTLAAGSYDLQKRSIGDILVHRGTSTPTDTSDAEKIDHYQMIRFTVRAGDTAYFYGNGVTVTADPVE
jgi:hypothetical protein